MNLNPLELNGDQFNLEDYLQSQNKTKQVVLAFSQKIQAGMTEKEGRTLLENMLDDSGLQKRWHPTKMRMGINTVLNFRDESEDYVLQQDDLFFADVGPVYFNHEGDYGESFVIGNNPQLQRLVDATKTIFYATQTAWKEQKLTGEGLYQFASKEAMKLNLRLNSNMYGHRLGDFPHALHCKEKLGHLSFVPAPNLWVLEIHVIDDNLKRGAFFEDILI